MVNEIEECNVVYVIFFINVDFLKNEIYRFKEFIMQTLNVNSILK